MFICLLDKPVNKDCPKCGASFLVEKTSRSGETTLKCPACKAKLDEEDAA